MGVIIGIFIHCNIIGRLKGVVISYQMKRTSGIRKICSKGEGDSA